MERRKARLNESNVVSVNGGKRKCDYLTGQSDGEVQDVPMFPLDFSLALPALERTYSTSASMSTTQPGHAALSVLTNAALF
jgi:hypothetical protein